MFSVISLILVALALPLNGVPFGAASASEVSLMTETGCRRGTARVQSVLTADGGRRAGVLLSVFDPKTSRYWSAGFIGATGDLTVQWGRRALSRMTFAVGSREEIVGFRSVQSQLQIRPSAARAVSLDAGHAVAVRNFSRARVGEGWRTVALEPSFTVCTGGSKSPPAPQVDLSVIEVRHENRRWYVTVKNICGKRRVVTLSESFELLN